MRTNRHKTNKRNTVSDQHLAGRWELLRLDLLDISREFGPYAHRAVIRGICAEMDLIEDEISVRLTPKKPKRTKVVPETEDSLAGMDELAEIYFTEAENGDS